ncbi:MAG: FecR family protein, partial [Chitinivibrionales bacterium]|nr:FecR family protein [Chitinivibrionales bacterium]
ISEQRRLFMRRSLQIGTLIGCLVFLAGAAGPVATISRIEGNASILRKGATDWRNARPNMTLAVGDQVYTREESFVELHYDNGAILRMDEKSKVTIEYCSQGTIKSRSSIGSVWVNMKKLTTPTKSFEVSSPTATAAIRGTIFELSSGKDSLTDVAVYDGKVAVGPTDSLSSKIKREKKEAKVEEPQEVPGPEEIPGPFEVPLEQWQTIIAGQKISVRSDGKFATSAIDTAAANSFVRKNKQLDKELFPR